MYGFILLSYSKFVVRCTILDMFDFKNAVTLKTGLGSVKVIEKVTIR